LDQLNLFPLCYKSRMPTILSCLLLLLFCGPKLIFAEIDPSWTAPVVPFQIADNLYYVGSQDLGSYLVVTPKGNILINANLAASPTQLRASVEALGFHWKDTRILLNGQAHADHMAGAAEVIREPRAKNMVMDGDVSVGLAARRPCVENATCIPRYWNAIWPENWVKAPGARIGARRRSV
jgi:metallo-beta-lactamase class B